MLRLLGGALVLGGTAWLGLRAAWGLKERERALREMAHLLRLLAQELELGARPLGDILDGLAQRCDGEGEKLVHACRESLDKLEEESFPAAWRRNVCSCRMLGEEGRCALYPLGDTLGQCDCPEQCRGLNLAGERLEKLADCAGEDCRRQGRVYQALGLSAGAFLLILLL